MATGNSTDLIKKADNVEVPENILRSIGIATVILGVRAIRYNSHINLNRPN